MSPMQNLLQTKHDKYHEKHICETKIENKPITSDIRACKYIPQNAGFWQCLTNDILVNIGVIQNFFRG